MIALVIAAVGYCSIVAVVMYVITKAAESLDVDWSNWPDYSDED